MQEADVIVIGVGAMGSSALYHLAQSGAKVIGLERFQTGHDKGSSHGESRIIRKAYFEHPNYVPLLHRAYELWDELNTQLHQPVLHRTGLIIYGACESAIIQGIDQAAQGHNLGIEKIDSASGRGRFPQFKIPQEMTGRYEVDAGYLEVENIIKAYTELAEANGAAVIEDCQLIDWKISDGKVQMETTQGSFRATKMVITGGAWNTGLFKLPKLPFQVHRASQFWFESDSSYTVQERFPCFGFHLPEGFYYGIPNLGNGIKIAQHAPGRMQANPDQLLREPLIEEVEAIQQALKSVLPELSSTPIKHSICMYTMTPDQHFLIDQHPETEHVIIAGGFSGHGFKFSSVIGEILCELSLNGQTQHSIDFLRWRW